jgi:hypothetical protein
MNHQFMSFIWVALPFLECKEAQRKADEEHSFTYCHDADCRLQQFQLQPCLNHTWLKVLEFTLPPIPIIKDNQNYEMAYFSPKETGKSNALLILSQLNVFTNLRTVGIGIPSAYR